MAKLLWGSKEFIARTEVINDQYVRPVDDRTDLHKLADCDMFIMQPLLDAGLWVRASDDEVRKERVTNG